MRDTTNRNARGSTRDRAARKRWLLKTFAADTTLPTHVRTRGRVGGWTVEQIDACRCYRCGYLLHFGSLTVDRIIPGCKGGTYRRNNIRPACAACNSETGGACRA
jgi:5-methylcytosine-specific restriction endonuclease McrA